MKELMGAINDLLDPSEDLTEYLIAVFYRTY